MSFGIFAQEQITLEECYQLVSTNYPLIKQGVILEKQHAKDLEVIKTGKLPQLDLNAQATYQSDVIQIPIPTAGIEPLNKDQYRASVSVNQLIYGGGVIDAQATAKEATLKTRKKQIEVNVYQLKKQVNQFFFSVLLLQEKRNLLSLQETQLQTNLNEIRSGIKNGVVLPTSDKVIEAELLKIKQQFTELAKNKLSLIESLSSLIGISIAPTTIFQEPVINTNKSSVVKRPELELFELKQEEIESSELLLSKQNSPKFIGFANTGYGNPGLNMLDNSFQTFYTVGVKLSWNVFDWNANKKQRESISINKDIINNEAEIFNLNTNTELKQQQIEIDKISAFIETDAEIISLRKDVLKSAESQLKNGVITTSAYIIELTNLYEDQNTLIAHTIQLQLAKANYNLTIGQ
jgi:outer membrane protein TolC